MDWLGEEHAAEKVHSVEKVFDEIKAGDDELTEWAQARQEFFLNPDADVVPSLQTVSNWAAGEGYEPAAVNTFLQGGDYYLVAHAHAHNLTVVTHEIPANSTKRIKIPNACISLEVKCMTPYEMLRAERARFVLGPSN